MSNPGPAVTNTSTETQTPASSGGYQTGQSVNDLIAFYGATPIAQQANSVSLLTQLINLGLVPAGTSAASNASTFPLTGATQALTDAQNGKTILFNQLAGTTVTLPAATGSGKRYNFLQTVIPTSNNNIIKVANAADFMIGIGLTQSDNSAAALAWTAVNSGTVATNSDTITLNRTTTGGTAVGEHMTLVDIAANTWQVMDMATAATGTEATPFSATV